MARCHPIEGWFSTFLQRLYLTSYIGLFTQASTFVLQKLGPVPLMYAGLANQEQEEEDTCLSSWVIDWRCTRTREDLLKYVPLLKRQSPIQSHRDDTIVVEAARGSETMDVVPFPNDLRYIVETFERLQQQQENVPDNSSH